ncbi:MAG: hypothetical protein QME51_08290, partial [Planctomycetota bacterium]|nr:hypothetical protein [Planctomycetota bacterium]
MAVFSGVIGLSVCPAGVVGRGFSISTWRGSSGRGSSVGATGFFSSTETAFTVNTAVENGYSPIIPKMSVLTKEPSVNRNETVLSSRPDPDSVGASGRGSPPSRLVSDPASLSRLASASAERALGEAGESERAGA